MGGFGFLLGILAVVCAVVGSLPLLGWLNWITTLPLALLAIFFSGLGLTSGRRSLVAGVGLTIGVLTLCWAAFRLMLGGGVL